MKIVKGTDPIDVAHPVFLVFGQPGICKTSLGYSMRDALLLDFDQGAHRASNRKDTLQIQTWADVEELMASRDALDPYQSLVIDTVGRCLDVLTADIAVKEPKKAPGGNLSQQGWGTLKSRFRTWVASVKTAGKDLLFVSHDKEDKDGDVRVVRPDIVGGSYGEVMKNADFVGYLYMSGKDRILDFNPTDRWIGKNPAQWPPFKVPEIGKATAFFGDLYAKGRGALGHISEASAEALQAVEAWRERIAACKTAAECNACIPPIKELGPLLQPQISKMLMDFTKSAGIPFDTGRKCFMDPTPATTAPAAPAGTLAFTAPFVPPSGVPITQTELPPAAVDIPRGKGAPLW